MKKLNFRICLIAALSLLQASCTNDSSPPPNDENKVTLTNSTDQSRLSNLDSPSHSASNPSASASVGFFSKGVSGSVEAPTRPAGAENLEGLYAWTVVPDTDYYLESGKSYSEQLNLGSGINYYISGDLTLTSYYGTGNSTIYILDGGSITLSGDFNYNNIACWGTVNFAGDFEIGVDGGFYNYTSALNSDYNLVIRGSFLSEGSVTAQNIVMSNTSGDATQSIKFNSCVVAKEEFYTENNANIYLSTGVKTATFTNDSYSKVYVSEGTLIQADAIYFENDSRIINESTEGYAVIDVERFELDNNTYIERVSGGEVRIDYQTISDDKSGNDIQWSAGVNFVDAIESNTVIEENECGFKYGEGTSEDEELKLEHVAKITTPEIERISATSIDFQGDYLYVSWHEKEDNYQGYIDAVKVSSLEIEATYYTTELDFNHIYLAENQNQIYVTGGRKAGAFYSAVTHNAAARSVSIEINKVEGASGNCIVEDDTFNWVISGANGGVTAIHEAGSNYSYLPEAKFITKFNNQMVVLAGVSTNNAKIHTFDPATGLEVGDAYTIGHIPTVDGKNTLFVNDNKLYACLGEGGLKIIDSSNSVVNSFYNNNGQGAVNCVYVDEKYIYMANGVAGLYILDKNSLEVLKTYQLGETSANYVKVQGDLIYVAYGLDGVHVFKLND